MSPMFPTVKRLYEQNRLNETGVRNAVLSNWITEEEYTTITNEEY